MNRIDFKTLSIEALPILLIVLFTLAPRVYAIDAPLADYHSWRQTHTAMVARNFLENGYNILNPQVDQFGPKAVFIESEFPLYQFAVALLYALTGVEDWAARAVAVAFACGAAIAVYFLVRSFAGRLPAFLASLFFAISPFGIFFGRAVMPESTMIFFSISSLGLLHRWLHRNQAWVLVGAIVSLALAVSVKLPSAHIILPAAYLIWSHRGRAALSQASTYFFLAGSLLPPTAWYAYAAEAGRRSGVSLSIASSAGGGRLGTLDLWLNPDFYQLVGRWLIDDVITVAGMPLVALGLVLTLIWSLFRRPSTTPAIGNPEITDFSRFLLVWTVAVFLYVLGAGHGLANQEYYILPAVPVASVLGGLGLAWLCRPWIKRWPSTSAGTSGIRVRLRYLYSTIAASFVVLCLVLIASLSFERISPLYAQITPYVETGKAVRAATPRDAAVIAVHHGEPEVLYYAQRRGWNVKPEEFSLARVELLRSKGATAVAIAEAVPLAGSQEMADVLRRYPALATGPFLLIIDLTRLEGQKKVAGSSSFSFGQSILLAGYEVATTGKDNNRKVEVLLRWKALKPMVQDYHISLRLFSPDSKLVAQLDGVPVNWFLPTNRWQTGDVIDDPYRLALPKDAAYEQLRLELVVYDGANLRPLAVDQTEQQSLDLGIVKIGGNDA